MKLCSRDSVPLLVAVLTLGCSSTDEAKCKCARGTSGGSGGDRAGGTGGDGNAGTANDGGGGSDGGAGGSDQRCGTQAVSLGRHPYASEQATESGRALVETEGYEGRLYFGYGDLGTNTGPIQIASYDPATSSWDELLLFDTEAVLRFRKIGDELWAPASDPRDTDPELAIGDANHAWNTVDIGASLHVLDAVERVPGEVYLVGSAYIDMAAGTWGGAVWRSTDGGPFTSILPELDTGTWDPTTYWFANAGVVDGKLYTTAAGSSWVYDGASWTRGPDLGEFEKPVSFAGVLVFRALRVLWSFDGEQLAPLDIDLGEAGVFEASDGHLVAVNAAGEVSVTTDLVEWTCIGQAPPDALSVGILDGVLFFGAADAEIYGYEAASW